MHPQPTFLPDDQTASQRSYTMRELPWQIGLVVAILALEGVGNLLAVFTQPTNAIRLAAKCLFIAGLLRRWTWVYSLYLVIGTFHVFSFARRAPLLALLNLILVILVASAHPYFSFRRTPRPCDQDMPNDAMSIGQYLRVGLSV